jgi:hypothetical protein
LLRTAQEHVDKACSPNEPGWNRDKDKWKREARAALERAKRLAEKRLKGKAKNKALDIIDNLSKRIN